MVVWISLGLFSLTFYIYQCIKEGEIKISDIFVSLFLLFIGVIGAVFIVCFLIVDNAKKIDKTIWKSKKDVE